MKYLKSYTLYERVSKETKLFESVDEIKSTMIYLETKGDITINDKPLLKFRLVKENLQEDVDYYFRHLEDDNFVIQTENDYFRIFKPINQSNDRVSLVYSYSNCNPFQWSEIAGEISRYVTELDDSENSEKSIEYAYIVKKEGGISNRKQIDTQMLLDDTFNCGEILSFTIGFR